MITTVKGHIVTVDDEDAYLLEKTWYIKCSTAGIFYVIHSFRFGSSTFKISLHHAILGKPPKGFEIDHVDRDGRNNHKFNLRIATRSQNNANSKRKSDSTTPYRGVSYVENTGKWRARCSTALIGNNFKTAEEAAKAYDEVARRIYGEFATTNF